MTDLQPSLPDCPECGSGMMIPEPWDEWEAHCSLHAIAPRACAEIGRLRAENERLHKFVSRIISDYNEPDKVLLHLGWLESEDAYASIVAEVKRKEEE